MLTGGVVPLIWFPLLIERLLTAGRSRLKPPVTFLA